MSSYYPAGCTQADHDRAFSDETREKCQDCDGTGDAAYLEEDTARVECGNCHGTGYEPVPDTREDDAYDASREENDHDIDF
jgi:DnaJ-class molecular chaperone